MFPLHLFLLFRDTIGSMKPRSSRKNIFLDKVAGSKVGKILLPYYALVHTYADFYTLKVDYALVQLSAEMF